MRLNTDMEWDAPFVDNRADVFGKVEINADGTAETFSLPQISGSDFPQWSEGNRFVSRPAPVGQPVRIVIRLKEDDWGATGFNDPVDTSPVAGKDDLEIFLDTCSMTITGDVTDSARQPIVVNSGNGWNQGTLVLKVTMADNRPLSTQGDVALVGFDLVQVLPEVERLVGGKPTVGLVTVANNTTAPQPVSVRLRVANAANEVVYDATESIGAPLAVGEVRSAYLATAAPILPEFNCKGTSLRAVADLVLTPGTEPPGRRACWVRNNSSGVHTRTVVPTRKPSLLWLRTGRLLDAGNLASMSQLNEIHDKAIPFMRGVYPTTGFNDSVSSIQVIPPLSGGVYDLISTLLGIVGLPADWATPFVMVYELNAMASLSGVDRLMGVLPKDWFEVLHYSVLDDTTGLSLGEWHPHAVIFEAVSRDGESNVGPRLVLPGHELGHTYGLSMDPSIKNAWCSLAGDLGTIACGMSGGFDEYNGSIKDGVPTWGYWVPQDSGSLLGLTGEQCDSHCMMGGNDSNADANWSSRKQWIDAADYNKLIDKLEGCEVRFPGTLYLSGVISGDDRAHLGWTFSQPSALRPLEFPGKSRNPRSPYGVVLLDGAGTKLSEAELPLNWSHAGISVKIAANFFAGHVAFPQATRKIQIWNHSTKRLLAERTVTTNRPTLSAPRLTVQKNLEGQTLDVSWTAKDADGGELTHFVMVSPDRGAHWWPVAHALKAPAFALSLKDVPKGNYLVRVLTSDGVNVESREGAFSF